ncbi:MAG: UvrD-helicase domain-containing protein [Clostridiales bacterium]|nr:UvrD-helicase domain-containing protein [Clostridiales bacterium]
MEFTDLNKEQLHAVRYTQGPLLVLAGAGSGKTRVLTTRIANLILNHGVRPYQILALTFTNKAAREMRERIESILGAGADDMWVSTFHSFCARVLRYEAQYLGFEKSFAIYDDADQLIVYAQIIKAMRLDDKQFPKRVLRERVSQAKNHALNPEEYLRDDAFGDIYVKVYKQYQKQLKQNNAMDFDDLLLKTIALFREHDEVLQKYSNRFQYVLVDEYQDTNMAQYRLIKLLCENRRNICVVGDDDQSIYGWRGADIRNILEFEKDFPGAQVIRLEQNYRSTSVILNAANSVIDHNKGRKKKKLWTTVAGGERLRVYQAQDEREEADYICRRVLQGAREGRRYDAFAVLYRTNAQSRMLETAFTGFGIPYKMYGGTRFYERAEIKDIMAYLRLIYNPADDVAFQRIINVPKRAIGAAGMDEMQSIVSRNDLPLFVAAMECQSELSSRIRPKIAGFVDLITKFVSRRETMALSDFAVEILKEIGYDAYLRDDKKENYETRAENIQEFLGAVREFESGLDGDADPLGAYLENVALISDIDSMREDNGSVALMTLHSAKGLEFPVVFMVGMEEGIFPTRRARLDPARLEEERRLCYVGITRARQELYFVYARRRMLFGDISYNMPSRFLDELPDELIEKEASQYVQRAPLRENSIEQPRFTVKTYGAFGASAQAAIPDVIIPKSGEPGKIFSRHQRVRHAAFGEGTVLQVEGAGSAQVITIDFGGTIKKFAAAFAPITPTEQ